MKRYTLAFNSAILADVPFVRCNPACLSYAVLSGLDTFREAALQRIPIRSRSGLGRKHRIPLYH